jgi:hypothetical protein
MLQDQACCSRYSRFFVLRTSLYNAPREGLPLQTLYDPSPSSPPDPAQVHRLQSTRHAQRNQRRDSVRKRERLSDLSLCVGGQVGHVGDGGEGKSWRADVGDGEDEIKDGVGGLLMEIGESKISAESCWEGRRAWTYDESGECSTEAVNGGDADRRCDEEAVGEEPEEDAEGGFGVRGSGLAVEVGAQDEHLKGGVECADAFDGLGDAANERGGSAWSPKVKASGGRERHTGSAIRLHQTAHTESTE